nr:hypothetical protein [Tanacetum cinerariifolium]
MQQFWYTIKKVNDSNSYEFLLANKKCIVDAEVFRKILDIYLRVEGEYFTEVQDDDATLTFLIELGYKGPLHKYTNMCVDHMHQPWRTLAAIINKCLSEKTASNNRLRKSRIDILKETNQAKVQEQDAKDKKRHISGKTKRKQQRKAQRRKASIQTRGQAKQERAGKHEKQPFDKDEKPYCNKGPWTWILDKLSFNFWSTAKMKTINGEGHIHAKVDGKKTKKHRKPRRKVIEVPQPSDPIEAVVDEAVYKELDDKLTKSERVSKLYNDSLLATCNTLQSNVDSMKLNELMELCTTLQSKVLELEKIKTTQALEINSLKRRVKKLEKKQSSRTHKLKRLYKVGLIARVKSSNDNEDLVNDQDDEQMFDVNDLQGEVFVQEEVADKEVNDAGEVTAASIATTDSATATMTVDEVTLAQALMEIKSTKPKTKGIVL